MTSRLRHPPADLCVATAGPVPVERAQGCGCASLPGRPAPGAWAGCGQPPHRCHWPPAADDCDVSVKCPALGRAVAPVLGGSRSQCSGPLNSTALNRVSTDISALRDPRLVVSAGAEPAVRLHAGSRLCKPEPNPRRCSGVSCGEKSVCLEPPRSCIKASTCHLWPWDNKPYFLGLT